MSAQFPNKARGLYCRTVSRRDDEEVGIMMEDLQSISTDRTRAPSFASRAASGRPTTSDL